MNIHLCATCAPKNVQRIKVNGIHRTIKCANCEDFIEPDAVISFTLAVLLSSYPVVLQHGYVTGFEAAQSIKPDNQALIIEELTRRNLKLHQDKHTLRVTPCHQCNTYPKVE
jgi:hypothetical protein